jgi:hypothetical protein
MYKIGLKKSKTILNQKKSANTKMWDTTLLLNQLKYFSDRHV